MDLKNITPLRITIYAAIFVGILIIILDVFYWPGGDNIVAEIHGLLFDVILFGLIIESYNRLSQKKEKEKEENKNRDDKIQRFRDELEDFAPWKSDESKYRIVGIIRRLNQLGIHDITLDECDFTDIKNLKNLNLKSSQITRINFVKSSVNIGNLTHLSRETHLNIDSTAMKYVDFERSNIYFVGGSTNFVGCNFKHTTIRGRLDFADFSSFKFATERIPELKRELQYSCITPIEIESKIIINKFQEANLIETSFYGTMLKDVTFENASIIDSNFVSKTYKRNELENLLNDNIYVTLDEDIKELEVELISKIEFVKIRTRLDNANFRGTQLKNVSFERADLSGADFEGAEIDENCTFKDAIFKNTKFNERYQEFLDNQGVSMKKIDWV